MKQPETIIKKIVLLSIILIMSSCAIKSLVSEKKYVYLPYQEVNLDNLGNGRIMIYNGHYYCPVITCGTTTKVNVLVNDKSFGQINYGEYFIVDIGTGIKSFHLEHKEIFKMKSNHKITIDDNTKVLKLEPTDFSHKLTITNELPEDLPNFRQLMN
ncbi:hypothetical protein ACCC68_08805 [Tenacibaculum maritimum]|uniref:hypothetical protein n=1 Tax=Tenacibaculum maritimum TaxID=107401 RepID=UPI00352B4DA9